MQDTQRKNKNHNLETFLAVAELPNYFFCFREAANTFYSRVFPFIKCSSVIGWKCKKCKSSRN